jgi:hypothetical protein
MIGAALYVLPGTTRGANWQARVLTVVAGELAEAGQHEQAAATASQAITAPP